MKQEQKKPSLVMNILSRIFSMSPTLPILFNCLVKARFLEALEIITKRVCFCFVFFTYLGKCKWFFFKGEIRPCCLVFLHNQELQEYWRKEVFDILGTDLPFHRLVVGRVIADNTKHN